MTVIEGRAYQVLISSLPRISEALENLPRICEAIRGLRKAICAEREMQPKDHDAVVL